MISIGKLVTYCETKYTEQVGESSTFFCVKYILVLQKQQSSTKLPERMYLKLKNVLDSRVSLMDFCRGVKKIVDFGESDIIPAHFARTKDL